jgi:hypothetical protein
MRSVTAKAILILLLSSATAFCQDFNVYPFSMIDYSSLGAGARARAMGGAFTGLANDASALTWNPAGLIQVDKTQASISGTFLPLQLKSTVNFASDPSKNIESKYRDDKLKPSFASFVAPVRIKGHPVMASATYSSYQDQLNEEHAAEVNSHSVRTSSYTFTFETTDIVKMNTSGGLDRVSLGFGTGLYGDLAMGGAVNIYTGTMDYSFRRDYYKEVPYYYGSQLIDTIVFHGVSKVSDISKQRAFNFTGSLLYHKDKLRAGVTIKSPYKLISKHDVTRADTVYVRSIQPGSQAIPTGNRPSMYLGKTRVEMPMDIAAGISYEVTPNFILAGDVQIADFSKSKYDVRVEIDSQMQLTSLDSVNTFTLPGSVYFFVPYTGSYYTSDGKYVEIFNTFDLNLEKQMQLRFGGEYTLKTKAGIVPLRAGVRITQGPYREVTQIVRDGNGQPQYPGATTEFALGDKVSNTAFSFGTGIHWRQIWLDFAAELNSEEQTETGSMSYGSFSATKKKTGTALTFNFTGFF